MSGDAVDQGTKQDANASTKDDATKDANAKGADDQGGKGTDADKSKKDDASKDDLTGLKKALAAERKLREGLEKEKREAELSKLPELERAQAQLTELQAENEKLKTELTRRQIGMELGLPWKLARRISGDTEDEMREDAADLLKDYKPAGEQIVKDDPKNKVKTTNDAKKTGTAGKPGMNDILRALAGKH